MAVKFYSALFILLFSGCAFSYAQQCDQWPADCAKAGEIQSAEDSSGCLANLILPEEISMQNHIRTTVDTLMHQLAAKYKWRMTKLDEMAASGRRDDNGNAIAPGKRPPHKFEMTYEFIVNEDSLAAWKKWITDFAGSSMDQMNEYKNSIASQKNIIQQYTDSLSYYTTLAGQNAADQAKFTYYMTKANSFGDKINNLTNSAQTQQASTNREAERTAQTIRYRDGSVVCVSIGINDQLVEKAGEPVSSGTLAGASLVRNYYNADPDLNDAIHLFSHSKTMTLILFGAWQTQTDDYGSYHAVYELNPANIDLISLKKIRSPVVQTIDIHLSGNKNVINEILQTADWKRLQSLF